MIRHDSHRRPWLLLLALLLGLGALYICLSGYVMAASFSVSNPERLVYWQRAAMAYLVGGLLSLIGILAVCVAYWRRRLPRASHDDPQAV